MVRLGAMLAVLAAFGTITPFVVRFFESSPTPVRIIAAVTILLPLGLFMGMAFPLGMKVASRRAPTLTPWLWGANGATSVLASVLTVAIAVDRGSGIAWVDGDGPGPGPTSPWESTLGVQRLRPMRPSVP